MGPYNMGSKISLPPSAQRPKICDFYDFLALNHMGKNQNFENRDGLEPRYDPISCARRYMNDYFIFGAVIVYVPMRHLIQGMGDMALIPISC